MTTPGFDLHRNAAAKMFKVAPAQVTADMVREARNAMRGLLYSSPPVVEEVIRVGVNMDGERRRTLAFWPKCPECRQDATGMYAGQPACTRCGWPAPRRKTGF